MASTLPESLRLVLGRQIDALKTSVPGGAVRWVSPQNIHLTLKFLGEVPKEKAERVVDVVRQVTAGKAVFDLKASGLGAFPSSHRPSVIWIGVQASDERLSSLQAQLESGLSDVGFERDSRPFHPHLTLGRVRRGLSRSTQADLASALSTIEVGEIGGWRVDGLSLMRSDLRPDGPRYTEVANLPLGSGEAA